MRSARLERLIGERIDPAESRAILERLGFDVTERDGDLEVQTPYFRAGDVQREVDVIEEVARIHGLQRLPATLPARRQAIGGLAPEQKLRRAVEDLLRARGLNETVTFSFIAPDAVERLRIPRNDDRARVLPVANPLSEEQSTMRTTLLPGLLQVAGHNLARDLEQLRLFETGRVFLSNGADRLPDEQLHLGVLLAGDFEPAGWRSPARPAGFYVIKGIVVAVLDLLGVDWRLADGGPPFLHPGRAAEVLIGSREAGYLGELHPLVARDFGLGDLEQPPAVMELDLDAVLGAASSTERRYEDLITYPAVQQDIAVIVEEAVEAQTVVDCVRAAAGPLLRSVRVFDLYRGEQAGAGNKSLALRLEFRSGERTLTDAEIAAVREQIKQALAASTGGTLRE
jgi:phenylalanyl-tRNA synthetase beta chain